MASSRPRPTARSAAKEQTRRRLLDAARRLILDSGETRVAASIVARRAGVAGATFYEHFQNRDDLLGALADDLFTDLREKLATQRVEALAEPNDEDRIRQEFRTPLEILVANPDLFRLALRARHLGSALGDSSRRLTGSTRRDVVAELKARGYPAANKAETRRLEMIADIHIAATEALALGYLAGRYSDLDELADMLVLVTRGTRQARGWRTRSTAPRRAATAN